MRAINLHVELLEQETGLWCRDCALPTGVRVTLSARHQNGLSLSSVRRCADCGGDQIDPDLLNAGKIPVTELPGASYFHHADSFGMMRGGHLDICVLGAFQVSTSGDLANWHTGAEDAIPAVGGAMDLAIGARQVFVIMELFTRDGQCKLVEKCSYPLTGLRCVDRVYTEHAAFRITDRGVVVTETYGMSMAELRDRLDVPVLAG